MEKTNTRGLQYGVREILMFVFAVAYLLGLTTWMWMKDIFEVSFFYWPLVFISGYIFFLIGRSMRSRTPERKLSKVFCSGVLALMILLISVFYYCMWASDHLQSHLETSKGEYELTNGFPHGWPYPDRAFPYLCDLDITTPSPWITISGESLRRLEYTIKTSYAPLFGGICLCLGILIPPKKKKKETILDVFDALSAAARARGRSSDEPLGDARSGEVSIPKNSPSLDDQNR